MGMQMICYNSGTGKTIGIELGQLSQQLTSNLQLWEFENYVDY